MHSGRLIILKRRFLMFRKNPISGFLINLSFALIIICTAALSIILKAQPILDEIAMSQIKYLALCSVNRAISEQLSRSRENYSDIIITQKDYDGRITSAKTDITKINLIKTSVTAAVLSEISDVENSVISIPLGSLTNIDFISGAGPKIKIKLLPTSTVNTRFVSSFSSCGINQSRHSIILQTQVDLSIVFPHRIKSAQIVNDTVIAETIIAGNIPESYTYIDDGRDSIISKANDYLKTE